MARIPSVIILAACVFCIFLCTAAGAQGKKPWKKPTPAASTAVPQKGSYVEIVILNKQVTDTSNPGEIMYTLAVQFTNKTKKAAQITNNDLFLVEDSGRKYAVNRLRFAESLFLEPGEPVSADRIYFTVPRSAKPQKLVLYKRGILAGSAAF